ncbi:MAG: ABC transporter ATP-binding protein [Mucispirillum sp.]|nr:ABC transporter ATP-binding protein [Mucispirillum sp.]
MTPLLEIRNVSKSFAIRGGNLLVLDNINETAMAGELIALTGPSGAGKSTLMNIIGGLDKPTDGKIIFQGSDIYSMSENELNAYRGKNMGFIFQFHYLLEDFTALENIMLPMLIAGAAKDTAEKRAAELIASVGLTERSAHLPSELSGGEQQRIAVARAVANNPRLILADEPTGNLDKTNSAAVLEILKNQAESGVCVIIVTHDENIADACHRRVTLQKL